MEKKKQHFPVDVLLVLQGICLAAMQYYREIIF